MAGTYSINVLLKATGKWLKTMSIIIIINTIVSSRSYHVVGTCAQL